LELTVRSSELRRVVLRGYRNLAIIIVSVIVLISPIIVHPGLQSARLCLIVGASLGIALALWQRLYTREWTTLFCVAVIVGALLTFATANLLETGWKNVLIPVVLAILWYALPSIAKYEQEANPPG
jgi:hypothetical protein